MKKAIIFDMDGTLLYTLDDLHEAVNAALRVYGYNSRSWNEIRDFVGNGVPKLIERALPNGRNSIHYEKVLAEFFIQYEKNVDKLTRPYEGIIPLLDKLKSKGVLLGVNSNKYDSAVSTLCSKYFPQIDCALGAREGVEIKPSPVGALEVMKNLGVKPIECLFVGDSDIDIKTAQNAGMVSVGVTWGYRSAESLVNAGADYIINSPEALLELV